MILLDTFIQIKEQHRGDQMTPGPKSQLLAGIVVDTIPGPVSIFTICEKSQVQLHCIIPKVLLHLLLWIAEARFVKHCCSSQFNNHKNILYCALWDFICPAKDGHSLKTFNSYVKS